MLKNGQKVKNLSCAALPPYQVLPPFQSISHSHFSRALFNMRNCAAAYLLVLLSVALIRSAQALPWEDLLLRCSIASSSIDDACALAQQSFKECDALFGGDEALLSACRAAVWADGENNSLQRVGTGIVNARWSSTPMGNFWFASASRADDTGPRPLTLYPEP